MFLGYARTCRLGVQHSTLYRHIPGGRESLVEVAEA
jgi:hypothetical protein